jgi:hypothetical protein
MVVLFVGLLFAALATLISSLNLMGWYRASQNARNGIPRGYSSVPLFGLLFSLFALACTYDRVGYLALLPAAFDPGTWTLIILPFYLVWCVVRRS